MKKNVRSVPHHVERRLEKFAASGTHELAAGCVREYSAEDLRSGALRHLGVVFTPGGLSVPRSMVPPESQGKYSAINRVGEEVIHRELGLQTEYHAVEAPNWGKYGTHTVYLPHQAYPKDFIPPRLASIMIECADLSAERLNYSFKFSVSEVLQRSAPDFPARLLASLNLLQENVGHCDIGPATSTFADYQKTLRLRWELLPPGSRDELRARVFRDRAPSDRESSVFEQRSKFIEALRPRQWVYGSSGFCRYFGALLRDDLVVFENVEYGNAVYLMFDDWQSLSQRSRIELLSGRFGRDFERVPHVAGWEDRVKEIIQEHKAA